MSGIDKNKYVFLDTQAFIYHIENNKKYQNLLGDVFRLIENGDIKGITSYITLLEILILPFKKNELAIVETYKKIFSQNQSLKTVIINEEIVEKAAWLRAKYVIKTPDAIQIAAAIVNKADIFFTNDKRLKQINEIKVMILDEFIVS